MAKTKYFDKIIADQARDAADPIPGLPPFDFNRLGSPGRWAAAKQNLIEKLLLILLWLARHVFPVFRLNGFYWVTRHADVLAILSDPDVFGVPYGLEMRELGRGPSGEEDFVLGIDGQDQQRQNAIIRRIIMPADADRIQKWSRDFSEALIAGGAGRLDVVGDLSIRVPTEICRRYFGLSIADPARFAEWAIAISAMLFADPGGDADKRTQGLAGAARLRRIIDAAIARAGGDDMKAAEGDFAALTLVERLVHLARTEPELGLAHAEIRAILLGLIVGFIPTNGLAAAKMLDLILTCRGAFRHAVEAARSNDRDAMRRIVLEAGRLNPALSPGQWRYTHREVTIGGKHIAAGSTIMVSTMSAMRDSRVYGAPGRFDPDADNDGELVFGHATHKCLGQRLATTIITEIFLPLFAQPRLRRARGRLGRMQRVGYFPQRLDVDYESVGAQQSMILAIFPLAADVADYVRSQVSALGNPAIAAVRQSLDQSGVVHFASATVVDAADDGATERPHLVLELNADGDRQAAVVAIVPHAEAWLDPLLRAAVPGDSRQLGALLLDHCIDLHFGPWGATGLNFFGTGDFPVAMIDRQHRLRERVIGLLAGQRRDDMDGRAFATMAAIRRDLRTDPNDADLDAFLVQPMRKQMPLSRWRKPAQFWSPLRQVLAAGLGLRLLVAGAVLFGLCMVLAHLALSPTPLTIETIEQGLTTWENWFDQPDWSALIAALAYLALLSVVALLASAIVLAAVGGLAYWLVRRTEDQEVPHDVPAPPKKIAEIAAQEDAPGYRQNHIIAVTPLKRGLVRRFTLAFALWGIRQSLYWFRPGYVVTMGTIHYAKWFRLPGSNKLIFQSNYDGSWESYLEDFITRAHQGQTAAWSNGVGFPRTKALIGDGASDGDRFKRWVRRQQVATAFWYSRFPELTTDHIRNGALLHDGLARAQTDTAARAWLDLLGSAQRQPYELESSEIQSLVFRGLKGALYTAYVPITLPAQLADRGVWFDALLSGTDAIGLTFGKFPQNNRAFYLGLSPAGLDRIGREGDAAGTPVPILDAFSGAFSMGMAARARQLGDSAAVRRWSDVPSSGTPVAEAVLIFYAPTADRLDADVGAHRALLAKHGGAIIHGVIRTVTLDKTRAIRTGDARAASYEHFGFRDGIAAPVIRGTEQFSPHRQARDIVEPGEFIHGYRNNQGYFAPSILVDATSDTAETLPIAPEATSFGFADFQNADEQFAPRDFARNGSFLVLRQLSQDCEGFTRYTAHQAGLLNQQHGSTLRDNVGDDVTPDWVAAKLMGRWRDGRPLVGNPTHVNQFNDQLPNNDFAYGRDDPRGHACPLGAHIRRANPRDSREPDDPLEQEITNRHMLIRRGRVYFYDAECNDYPMAAPPATAERGMVFAAICADLERQFELVQQSWLGSPAFHGLEQETDPITTEAGSTEQRRFTIPTSGGPLMLQPPPSFVSLKGGGYFFLPSRAAVRYLANLSRNAIVFQF